MKATKLLVTMLITAGLAFATTTQAVDEKETPVEMKDLPRAVQKTIRDKAAGAEIVRIEKELEGGVTWVYEAIVRRNGKEWGINVDHEGRFLGQHNENKERQQNGEKH